jgi:O-succinylbenzoate synthase
MWQSPSSTNKHNLEKENWAEKMLLKLTSIEPYSAPMKAPVRVGPELWHERHGLQLSFTPLLGNGPDRRNLCGEVAPLPRPWGGAPLEEIAKFAQPFLQQAAVKSDWLKAFAPHPVLQSAILMAYGASETPPMPPTSQRSALITPSGLSPQAISLHFKQKVAEGYRTFKLKATGGLDALKYALDPILENLPAQSLVRLDPNQSLTVRQLEAWLNHLDGLPIESIEEPLSPDDADALWSIAKESPIPLMLDEQVKNFLHLKALYEKGWPGWFLVRPTIFGDPSPIEPILHTLRDRLIYASSFEAFEGRNWLLKSIAEAKPLRAVGLDPLDWVQVE